MAPKLQEKMRFKNSITLQNSNFEINFTYDCSTLKERFNGMKTTLRGVRIYVSVRVTNMGTQLWNQGMKPIWMIYNTYISDEKTMAITGRYNMYVSPNQDNTFISLQKNNSYYWEI